MSLRFGMLTGNAVIDCALLAWFLAQFIKVLLELVLLRRFDARRFVSSGGMPSSHSVMVVAATAAIGKLYGTGGAAFALAVVAIVFMMISTAFAFNLRSAVEDSGEAVVTVPVSSVKSSPGSTDQSLFILHEGTKVSVVDSLGEWYRIELSDGRQGWMQGNDMKII